MFNIDMHYFITKLLEQLLLVGLSTGAAIVVGIPPGIFVLRYPLFKKPVIGIANILQTIPSLALLAFLLPFLGIGTKPAVVTISIYCLLPLVQNTILGLESVPQEVDEAGNALGFSFWQKLWFIDMPLALPVIIGGIRIAVVMAVGISTLAAFIGAGGLGDYITQGLALNNNRLILIGAIPAALLALVCDKGVSAVERALTNKHFSLKKLSIFFGACFLIIMAFVILGGRQACFNNKSEGTITIASKNFTEQFILAELMAELIETKTNLNVIRKPNLGATSIVHQALLRGEVDMYPEYTGTAYLTVLHRKPIYDEKKLYQALKNEYEQKYNLTWLEPFALNNTTALIVTKEFAKKHKLSSISDLKNISAPLIIGTPAAFIKREDGYPGLVAKYNLQFDKVVQMDPSLMYKSLHENEVNVIAGFSTDGRIPLYQFVSLKDDKHFYPPYHAAPVIRLEILKKHPEIATALQPLAKLLTNETLQKLNAQVDIEQKSPAAVAHTFLRDHNLIR